MKPQVHRKHSFARAVSTALFLGMVPFSLAQADTTGYLSPSAAGFYQQWIRADDITQINDAIGCPGNDDNWATSNTVNPGDRGSAVISLAGVPDDATIDSIDIQVCQTRGNLGGNDALFQLFARVDGVDADSGVDIDTNDDPNVRVASVQTIPVGIVKDGATTVEVGVIKTSGLNVNATRVFTLSAQINFTPAAGPVPPPSSSAEIPVFGPFGLLLTVLGIGLIGAWKTRRKG